MSLGQPVYCTPVVDASVQALVARFIKINCDVLVNRVAFCKGFGVVLCDLGGRFVALAAGSSSLHCDISMAESLVVKEGLLLAAELGCIDVVVNKDCFVLVSAIVEGSIPLNYLDFVISDNLFLLASFHSSSIAFTPQSCNHVAHCLVVYGRSINSSIRWVYLVPIFLSFGRISQSLCWVYQCIFMNLFFQKKKDGEDKVSNWNDK